MAQKLKKLAGESSDSELSATIRDSASNIWLAGLGAFVKAQAEGGKVFDALVKEGEKFQKRAKKVADDKVVEMNERASSTWDKLEQVFEDRVARALHSLNVPTKKDIDTLSKRVEKLTTLVEELSAGPAQAAPKPRARRTTKAAG
ncbi:MAG: phasin family protein [Kiloniellales bacterium]|nr:phasin family protein [Kiloniellales bacterium]